MAAVRNVAMAVGLVLAAMVAQAHPRATPVCDGDPPKLVNHDDQDHRFELRCGKKTETGELPKKGELALEGKSGCRLKLGDNPETKLFTEMVCTVDNGKLSCDLL